MIFATLQQHVRRGASDPLAPGAAIAGLSIALLLGAYAFQYLGGLAPCPLCLEQRVPWYVLIVLGGAIVGAHVWDAPRPILLGLYAVAGAVALWGAYLGLYHAGVEYRWWPGPPDCTSTGLPTSIDFSDPISRSDIVLCDEVPWSLFGISLAGFNFLFSLVAVGLAGVGGWTAFKEKR